ncbi:MAG: hypothetical protein AB7R55_19885 [Gemmatimonadales bacterium]
MSDIFDRFRTELDQLGDRVKDAVESSRLHLERSSLVGQRSKLAYKLGMKVYRKERGGEDNQAEIDALFSRMDDVSEKIAEVDRKLDDLSGESVRVDEKPAPEAETGEAEVSEAPASDTGASGSAA